LLCVHQQTNLCVTIPFSSHSLALDWEEQRPLITFFCETCCWLLCIISTSSHVRPGATGRLSTSTYVRSDITGISQLRQIWHNWDFSVASGLT
jgi:hypothetical protein